MTIFQNAFESKTRGGRIPILSSLPLFRSAPAIGLDQAEDIARPEVQKNNSLISLRGVVNIYTTGAGKFGLSKASASRWEGASSWTSSASPGPANRPSSIRPTDHRRRRANGKTIVMVIHDRDLAKRVTRTITIADGEIVKDAANSRRKASEPVAATPERHRSFEHSPAGSYQVGQNSKKARWPLASKAMSPFPSGQLAVKIAAPPIRENLSPATRDARPKRTLHWIALSS